MSAKVNSKLPYLKKNFKEDKNLSLKELVKKPIIGLKENQEVLPNDFRKFLKKDKRVFKLGFLNPGERFEFVGLENDFKNLFVKRVSECSVLIGGDIKIGEEEVFDSGNKKEIIKRDIWKNVVHNHYVSCSSIVKIL